MADLEVSYGRGFPDSLSREGFGAALRSPRMMQGIFARRRGLVRESSVSYIARWKSRFSGVLGADTA